MSKAKTPPLGRRDIAADRAVSAETWPRGEVKLTFFLDAMATRCSLCNRRRIGVHYIGATAGGSNYFVLRRLRSRAAQGAAMIRGTFTPGKWSDIPEGILRAAAIASARARGRMS